MAPPLYRQLQQHLFCEACTQVSLFVILALPDPLAAALVSILVVLKLQSPSGLHMSGRRWLNYHFYRGKITIASPVRFINLSRRHCSEFVCALWIKVMRMGQGSCVCDWKCAA
mmetsp:Transcript_53709/g.174675  ORF Transcript_53709/g.174675 Transcript_53709/m.174675 type:complete len:113 (-) Transcript_53709:93-431(-)